MRISDWSSDVCSSDLIGGVTEGDSRHACAEASISTFDESQLFNRDCPAVAADQARRGEGGGDHAATFGARRSARERTDSSFDRDEIVAPLDRDFFQTPSIRSEEHTSELQSLMRISYAVFCLKKKITVNDSNV